MAGMTAEQGAVLPRYSSLFKWKEIDPGKRFLLNDSGGRRRSRHKAGMTSGGGCLAALSHHSIFLSVNRELFSGRMQGPPLQIMGMVLRRQVPHMAGINSIPTIVI